MNQNLELFVNKYCQKHEVSQEEALTHATVKAAAEYYALEEKRARDIIRVQDGVSGGDCE